MRELVAVIALLGLALPTGATETGTCYVESTDQGNRIVCDDAEWIKPINKSEPAIPQPIGGATECSTGTIYRDGASPLLTRNIDADSIRYDIVGHFVNYSVNGEARVAVAIPDSAIGLTVCPEGITFDLTSKTNKRHTERAIVNVDADIWVEHVHAFDAHIFPF